MSSSVFVISETASTVTFPCSKQCLPLNISNTSSDAADNRGDETNDGKRSGPFNHRLRQSMVRKREGISRSIGKSRVVTRLFRRPCVGRRGSYSAGGFRVFRRTLRIRCHDPLAPPSLITHCSPRFPRAQYTFCPPQPAAACGGYTLFPDKPCKMESLGFQNARCISLKRSSDSVFRIDTP
jgi:hypothetical protein